MTEYSLDELQKLAAPALQHAELVTLATNHSPSRAYELAISHWPRRQARAARFLAMMRRDHGRKVYETFLTSIEHARPHGTEHVQGGNNMSASVAPIPQFLYPRSRQFFFDEVTESIVRQLEIRNWSVPGITVEFDEYGSGAQKFRLVRKIKGQDFKLYFCRVQGRMPGGHWNDTAAVTEIVIPEKELHVYDDESGPSFYLYVGGNWQRDREKFMSSSKVNSKLNKEPRMYLKYKGACACKSTAYASFEGVGLITAMISGDADKLSRLTHSHDHRRSPLLVHDNDLGREYEPQRGKWNWLKWSREPNEPSMFKTADVMNEFTTWLENNVLGFIMSQPVPAEKIDVFAAQQDVPFPHLAILGELFCFAEYQEAQRIKQGQENVEQLQLSERYALSGGGYRLVSLDVPNDGTLPKIAYDGFLWCGIAPALIDVPIDSLEVPGHYRWDRESYVIRIKPRNANNIYIADHAPHDKRRKEICDALENRRDLTNAEVADFIRARGRTIIPISEYKGGFEKPVVLINRELDFNEVEIISGPGPHSYGR